MTLMIVNPYKFYFNSFVSPTVLSLSNPGAEAGDASGWTAASGGSLWTSTNAITTGFPATVYEGARYFSGGVVAAARMYQDIDVSIYSSNIDSGGIVAELGVNFCTYESYYDYLSIFIRALDSSNAVITTVAQEDIFTTDHLSWLYEDLNLLLPSGTKKVRIEVHATRTLSTENSVFIDSVSLTLYDNSRRITPTYGAAVSRGNRTSAITITATNLVDFGTRSTLVDGANTNNYFFNGATNDGTNWLTFDFGAGNSYVIDEFIWKQQNTTAHGIWRFEGSNDNSSWTQIGSDFTLTVGLMKPGGSNNTAYRYYRLRAMSGSRSANPYIYEIQFRAK
jgi:hypothetical protein